MEDNRIFSQELEEMRSQVAILKKKLDKQTIITEAQIRNSLNTKRSEITRTIAATIIVGFISVPYTTWIFYKFGFSLLFIIATDVMLAVCLGITIRQRYVLKKLDFAERNLLSVAESLNMVKTHYKNWIKIALPMILTWTGWLAYEAFRFLEPGPMKTGFMTGAAVGLLLGGVLGYRINRKIVNKSAEILDQIKELQNI